jgi:ankyrin repeat protein
VRSISHTNAAIRVSKFLCTLSSELLTLATVSGATALHVAVQVDRKDMIELLLDAGANVNAKKGDGDTRTWLTLLSGPEKLIPIIFLCSKTT